MNGTDYLRVLRSLPGLILVLRPDARFTIVDASDAYLRATHTLRERIVGRPLFEVFPANPDHAVAEAAARLSASLGRAIDTGVPDTLNDGRYDIPAPASGGGFEERWWRPVNIPVAGEDGRVVLIVHQVEDVTELHRLVRQELRASEILESITEGFLLLDRDWRFTYLNREGSRILGAAPEEVLGRTLWEAYPGLEGTEFERHYRSAMEGRQTAAFTAFYAGHQRWYEVHVYPSRDGVAVYFRNVTAQRQVESERLRLAEESDRQRRIHEVVLSNTPDLVFTFDLQHRFTYANEALTTMWGIPLAEALGKTTRELGYPEWQADMHDREIEEVIATRKPIHGEVPFTGATGRRVWDYIFAPVIGPGGDVVAIAGTARDTTERRETDEAMAEHSRRLQQADRAKDEFIATLSHELRNPLAPLRNAVALMRMDGNVDPRTAAVVAMMERQVNHLVRLVDDLLEISRVTRGDFTLRLERTQLAGIVRNAIETSAPVVEAHRHALDVSLPDAPVWVDADAVRLAQVVSNLLDNAAKYTPPGGRIEVRLERKDDEAIVRVRDNGPGIEPAARERIFEMFNRGDRAAMLGEGGLGIGLALSRRLAEMHGGRLEVESEGGGRGSEFRVCVPAREAPASAGRERPAAPGVASRRILVVDDNGDAADSLGMILRELGADVRIEHDGPAAITAFPEFAPDAVLLDIGMPGMDGYDVARALRSRYPERAAKLIALTGWGQEQDRDRARAAGFDHHIVKPADLAALRSLLGGLH